MVLRCVKAACGVWLSSLLKSRSSFCSPQLLQRMFASPERYRQRELSHGYQWLIFRVFNWQCLAFQRNRYKRPYGHADSGFRFSLLLPLGSICCCCFVFLLISAIWSPALLCVSQFSLRNSACLMLQRKKCQTRTTHRSCVDTGLLSKKPMSW